MARIESATTAPEMANQIRRRPMKSQRSQRGIPWPVAPMKRGLSNQSKPPSTARIARVAATAVSIERAVPMRSMSANPRTLAVATTNSTMAVIAVTTFASTIVAKPFRYPCAIAARTDLPARTSSLMRSKMTMFASAATPNVSTRPAKPGSVSVTLKMRMVA